MKHYVTVGKKWRFFLTIMLFGVLRIGIVFGQLQIENLGEPVRIEVPIEFVTRDTRTGAIAWAGFAGADRYGVVGVHIATGAVIEVDLSKYGKTIRPVQLFKYSDQQLFMFAGNPGRFFKYDVPAKKLTLIGEATKATFWYKKGSVMGCSGNIYVGTYPHATVAVLNPASSTVSLIEHVGDDASLNHVGQPACSDDGILYFPVGMREGKLWSYNPATGEMHQILPEHLQTYGLVTLWKSADGKVYGKKDTSIFVCHVSGIQLVENTKPVSAPLDNEVNGKIALRIDKNGRLILKEKDTRKETYISTSFRMPAAAGLFRLGDAHQGKLFGSSYRPGITFTYDLQTGQFEDLGVLANGKIQVYDFLSHELGLFMASYTGGHIDFYPAGKELVPGNRKHVVGLHATENQERNRQLMLGPDGMVYCPTAPIKGMLGGRLTRIDPKTLAVKSYKDTELIEHQSYVSATAVPETNELFITSSIRGGTDAKPIAKEAFVFLWNTKTESVSFRTQPLPGVSSYGRSSRANNGIIYGFSGSRYYAFDPRKRKTVFTGVVKRKIGDVNRHDVLLCENPAANGLIYGVDPVSGSVITIDPKDHRINIVGSDPSLIGTRFVEIYPDGYLYYGHNASLMRLRVSDDIN